MKKFHGAVKKFHGALKSIYGPKTSGATTLLGEDESILLTDKEASLSYHLLGRYGQNLLNRLNVHLDQKVSEDSEKTGTIGTIFTSRQLQEKCQEQNVDLYMTFVDLTKAFDTVSRDGLWTIMAKFGDPTRFIAMVFS